MSFLDSLNGNYFINRSVNLSLEQVDKIAEMKLNKLFKLNLIKLKNKIEFKNKTFILLNDAIIIK